MPDFCRCVDIGYTGAETPDANLKGWRVYGCPGGRGTPAAQSAQILDAQGHYRMIRYGMQQIDAEFKAGQHRAILAGGGRIPPRNG